VSFLKVRAFEASAYYGNIAAGYLVSNTSELMKRMLDNSALIDFVSIISALVFIYFMLLMQVNSKKSSLLFLLFLIVIVVII